MPKRAELAALLLAVSALAGLLHLLVVPGVFTIDENNYLASLLAVRQGSFSLPETAGLPPSRELVFFDPAMAQRPVTATPVTPAPPPMYAFLAYPFAWLGWSGLFTLNILAFLAAGVLVFLFVRRLRSEPWAAWLGLAAFWLGGLMIDYALGAWPHALSVALCFAAVYLAMLARERGGVAVPALSGLLAGLAAGVRYQDVVFGGAVGLGLLLWSKRRWRTSLAYAAGFALPLVISAGINKVRLGIPNPITKGARYLSAPLLSDQAAQGPSPWTDGFWALATRVVDFSWLPFSEIWASMGFQHDARTGAFIGITAVRKALLQSAPWIALSLVGLLLAWRRRRPDTEARVTVELRALSLPVLAMLVVFFVGGTRRIEGAVANSRYLLELVPVAAAALPLVFPGTLHLRGLLVGAGVGGLLAAMTLLGDPLDWPRQLALLKLPLLLAVVLLALLFVARQYQRAGVALAAALGACIAWGFAVHVGDDWVATRRVREGNLSQAAYADLVLPTTPSALLAAHPSSFGPLKLERDVVLVSLAADHGADSLHLVDALLAKGRRVFFFMPLTPDAHRQKLLAGRTVRVAGPPGSPFVELVGQAGASP